MFLQVAKLKEAKSTSRKNRSEIGRIIDTLSRYAMRHFAEEEAMDGEAKLAHRPRPTNRPTTGCLGSIDLFRERYSDPGAKITDGGQFSGHAESMAC